MYRLRNGVWSVLNWMRPVNRECVIVYIRARDEIVSMFYVSGFKKMKITGNHFGISNVFSSSKSAAQWYTYINSIYTKV